jgi:PadR family transcriptional regulator PadR
MSVETKQRDLFPGALELMVLRLVQSRPLHGYALVAEIKQSSGDLLHVEEGSLYMALQRMLKERWLSAKWTVSPTNRRVRVYSITPAGRKRLTTEVSKFAQMLEGVHRVLRYEH